MYTETGYTEYDLERLSIKQGCTESRTICGRNEFRFSEMVELDFKICIKTV